MGVSLDTIRARPKAWQSSLGGTFYPCKQNSLSFVYREKSLNKFPYLTATHIYHIIINQLLHSQCIARKSIFYSLYLTHSKSSPNPTGLNF